MRVTKLTAGIVVLLAVFTACGSSDDDPGTDEVASLDTGVPEDPTEGSAATAPTDPDEAMLAYTECMRDHGIDLPDPQITGDEGGDRVIALEVDPNSDDFASAQEECEPLMADAFGAIERDPVQEAQRREQLLEYAACMREHGIDMPDPVFDADGGIEISAGGQFDPGDKDFDFESAAEACGEDGMFMSAAPVAGGED